MKKHVSLSLALLACMSLLSGCGGNSVKDEYENGKLVLKLRNLYFADWEGGDSYTTEIEQKFGVKIKPSSYDYNSWGEQVSSSVNANNIGDVFHFDLESFNFGSTYKRWAQGKIIKPLPDDLSNWPKIKALIDNTSNIDKLKIGGKLYGLPLAYNQDDPSKNYSSFTYVYHRDWAKQLEVYKENDIYTWEEFQALLNAFKNSSIAGMNSGDSFPIGDVSWGFPSLTNFFKDSPHCYTYRDGKVVNAFTTDEYIDGLNFTKGLIGQGMYFSQESNYGKTLTYDAYKGGHLGVYYENLSLSNYSTLRKDYKKTHANITAEQLDDATAIMKIKGPDGKYHLEGSENWFSMTMFNYDISDNKMNKILDILEYLLGEEGTRLAIYGKENVDYTINDGEVELVDTKWIQVDGEYAQRVNGAKYLREMITLNNDTASFDPYTNLRSFEILKAWQEEMNQAKANNQLVIFQEPSEIKWLTTAKKDQNTSGMIEKGNENAMKYCYGSSGLTSKQAYINAFPAVWNDTIREINSALGL